MLRVFNMGIGMVVVTAPDVELDAIEIGRVVQRGAERVQILR
jgi:phosphoribosylaminoimidazole (AIR) synthetase